MNTVHNYIYAQEQMDFSDMDCSDGAGVSNLQVEELCVVFPDIACPNEVHPVLGYCGC